MLERFRNACLVGHILLGQVQFVDMFVKKPPDAEQIDIFQSMLRFGPPEFWRPSQLCPSYRHVEWDVRDLLIRVLGRDVPDQMFYLYVLRSLGGDANAKLAQLMSMSQWSKSEIASFFKLFPKFLSQHRGLSRALQPTIQEVMSRIGPDALFKTFDMDVFGIMKVSMPVLQAFSADLVTKDNLARLMNNIVFCENDVVTLVQYLLTHKYSFPKGSQLFGESDSYLTLVNEIALKKRVHFVDFVAKNVQRLLMTNQGKQSLTVGSVVCDMSPYFLLSVFDDLKDDRCRMLALMDEYGKELTLTRKLNELFTRFRNDDLLIQFLYSVTGKRIGLESLVTTSIPVLVRSSLPTVDINILDSVRNNSYFIISDRAKRCDFSFFFAYKAIVAALGMIAKGEQHPLSDYIECIDDREVRMAIINDIFSMLFLKRNGSDEFFCSVSIAEEVLMHLSNFIQDSMFFNIASDKLMFARVGGSNLLQTALFSAEAVVVQTTEAGDYDVALNMTKGNPKLMNMVRMIRKMKTNDSMDDVSDIPIFSVEYFLAKDDKDENRKAPEISKMSQILGDGKSKECLSVSRIVSVEVQSRKLQQSDPMDITMSSVIKELSQNEATLESISDKKSQAFKLFAGFQDYLSLYLKVAHLPNSHLGTRISHRDIVQAIISSGQITSWDALVTLLGPNAAELIFRYSSYDEIKSSLFHVIYSHSNPTGLALLYEKIVGGKGNVTSLRTTLSDIIKNERPSLALELGGSCESLDELDQMSKNFVGTVFDRFLLRKLDDLDGNGYQEVEDIGESLNGYSSEQYHEMIDSVLNQSNINRDQADSLFYIAPDSFLDYVRNHLHSFTPSILIEFIPFAGFSSLNEMIRRDIQSTDPNILIPEFLSAKDWTLCTQFIHDFEIYDQAAPYFNTFFMDTANITAFLCTFDAFVKTIHNKLCDSVRDKIMLVRQDLLKKQRDKEQHARKLPVNDSMFNSIVEQSGSFNEIMMALAKQYTPVYYFSTRMVDWIRSSAIKIVSQIVVNSINVEDKAHMEMKKLTRILAKWGNRFSAAKIEGVNEVFVIQIKIAMAILEHRPCLRFGMGYSFTDFSSKETAGKLARLCSDLSLYDVLSDLCRTWEIDPASFVVHQATICFSLGLLTGGLEVLKPLTVVEMQAPSNSSDSMVDAIVHPIPVDIECLIPPPQDFEGMCTCIRDSAFPSDTMSIYATVKSKLDSQTGIFVSSTQMTTIEMALGILGNQWSLVSLSSSFGRFDKSFEVWLNCDKKNRIKMFLSGILLPSLAHRNWNMLWRRIEKSRDEMKDVLDYLFNLLKEKQMYVTQYDIQIRIGYFDDAITLCMKWLVHVDSFKTQTVVCDYMEGAVDKAIAARQSRTAIQKTFAHRELVALKNRIQLQKDFAAFCQRQQIQFSPNLELLVERDNAMASLLLMMRLGQFQFAVDAMPYMTFSFRDLCDSLLDSLSGTGDGALLKFFKDLAKIGDPEYTMICTVLVERMADRMPDKSGLHAFIKSHVKSESAKAKLFQEFGFLQDAFASAKSIKDASLIREIRDQATAAGDTALVQKCNRYLK